MATWRKKACFRIQSMASRGVKPARSGPIVRSLSGFQPCKVLDCFSCRATNIGNAIRLDGLRWLRPGSANRGPTIEHLIVNDDLIFLFPFTSLPVLRTRIEAAGSVLGMPRAKTTCESDLVCSDRAWSPRPDL